MSAPNYLTLANIKAYFANNEVATTTKWDGMINLLIPNVSRAWDRVTFRREGSYAVASDTTEYFDGVPGTATSYAAKVFIDEMAQAPTSVALARNGDPSAFATIPSSDYFLWPYNASHENKPYLRLDLNPVGQTKSWPCVSRSIQVTAHFGYSLVPPDDMMEALYLYVVKLVRKGQQNYLETGTVLDMGQIMVGMKLDPDINMLIKLYQRWRDQ